MEEIIYAQKIFNGVEVTFRSERGTISEHFSYDYLVEMQINLLDLLEHPEHYAVERDGPRIVRTDFCSI